jgi:[calcium/calmodulin-dependent protein kinase] kinase
MLDDAEQEAEIMAACACANVVRVREWVDAAGEAKARLVMEWCSGGCLVDDADTFEAFSVEKVRAVMRDVFQALRTCHERGFVHFDIKPQNIFVSGGNDEGARVTYKLGDFGSATRVEKCSEDEGNVFALVSKTPGTPAFTAPECCEGEPCDGFKADVWATGMTAHALATGKYFYKEDGPWQTYQLILSNPEVDMSEVKTLGDDAFTDFLSKILAVEPSKRLTAAQALEHPWLAIGSA